MRHRSTHALRAIALTFAIALTAAKAHAADPPRVVVVAADRDRAMVERLRAELVAMGFDVTLVPLAEGVSTREALEGAAKLHNAVASMHVTAAARGIELWVADRVTGKTVLRDVVAPDGGAHDTIALRAVELLRASLMEMDAPHPPRGDTPAPPSLRAVAGVPPPRAPASGAAPTFATSDVADLAYAAPALRKSPWFGVSIGGAAAWSPGGLGPHAALDVGLRAWVVPRVAIEVAGAVPLTTARHDGAEGYSINRFSLFLAGARVELGPLGSRVKPSLGGGFALVWLHAEGVGASPGYVGATRDAFTGGPYLRPGLGVVVAGPLRIRADVLAGVAFKKLVLTYASREAAGWGQPFVVGSVGVEMVF